MGKQNLRDTCPKGKLEFKFFSSPASDFLIFFFKAMVLSSYLVLLLMTLGLYISEGRLRVGGRWPLSSSSSLYNSSSSFTALISFASASDDELL